MALTGVKRRFNAAIPGLQKSKATYVALYSCGRHLAMREGAHHLLKYGAHMVCFELQDEFSKVVRITILGARHIAAVKELAFGAMVEMEGADCTDVKGNLSLFANSRSRA
eukprot:3244637-Amphidinium_carterae.1